MKLKTIIQQLISIGIIWRIVKKTARISGKLVDYRKLIETTQSLGTKEIAKIFIGNKVLNGPFKGMIYPKHDSVGSSLMPKLLGSYERELHSQFSLLAQNDYTEIVDVGCAEGYYAVGLATMFPTSTIHAFDTDKKAQILCEKMAQVNGVSDRVKVESFLSPGRLRDIKFTGRGLIICDCEGFEKELFDQDNVGTLANCDLIIETHDFIDIEISGCLKRLFGNTHHVSSIFSTDDIQKVHAYQYKELTHLSPYLKKKVLAENRPAIMEWLILTPKEADNL